jgi:hypothetical protein
MRRAVLIVGLLLPLFVTPALAQDVIADVRSWDGRTWRITSPAFEVFYTVVPPPVQGTVGAPTLSGGAGASQQGGTTSTTIQFDPYFTRRPQEGYALAQGPSLKQGTRQQTALTLVNNGISTGVPIASIATLTFARQQVSNSGLPPHLAPDEFRHGATVVLTDGSRVTGDYVNLGTAVLRGATPHGTVDIPWQQIETVRFQR